MPDDKAKTRPQDANRINVHEDYEVRNWAKKFGVTEQSVREAVARVGTSAKAVEKHLKQR